LFIFTGYSESLHLPPDSTYGISLIAVPLLRITLPTHWCYPP